MIIQLDYKPITGYIGSKKDYKILNVYEDFDEYIKDNTPSNKLGHEEGDIWRRLDVCGWDLTKTLNGNKCMIVDTEFKSSDIVYDKQKAEIEILLIQWKRDKNISEILDIKR